MNKFKLLVAPILIVPFLVNCGGGSTEYKVEIPDTNGVSIYPGQAYKGKEYVGTIEIATDIIDDQLLPDKLDKVTSGNSVLQPTEYTYTLKEDKLSADFKIPAENVVGDVAIQLTLVEMDPSIVNADKFAKAISFQGIEYMQCKGKQKGECDDIVEFSPNVSHTLTKDEYIYNETYVTKNSSSYEGISRNKADGSWKKMDSEEAIENYFTPATYLGKSIEECLKRYGVDFSTLKYNSETKDYSCAVVFDDEPFTMKFAFNNKRLISCDTPIYKAITITYNETPVVPPQL